MRRTLRNRREDGFTLPELLVVIVIVGLIAAPLASAIFVGFHDTGNIVDRFSKNHDLNMLSSFLDTDVQSAQGVYTTGTTSFTVDLNGVSFPHDSSNGWAAGSNGYIINTTDGGSQWDVQHDNLAGDGVTGNLNDIVMAKDNLTGWAVGDGGKILATVDGGATWTAQPSGTANNLRSVWVWQGGPGPAGTPTQAWAVGDNGSIRTLACSAPGNCSSSGVTWAPETSPTGASLSAVAFDGGGNNGMAVGAGGVVLATANKGSTWIVSKTLGTSLTGVAMKDANHTWAVGPGGFIDACNANCVKTNPTWVQPSSPPTSSDLAGVWAVSNQVWAVGADGTMVICTANCSAGNATWGPPPSPGTGTQNDLTAVAATDTTHAWAVGKTATILATQINLWTTESSSATDDLRGVWALDKDHVWIVGLGGVMLSTAHGSTSQAWTNCADTNSCPTANDLYAVTALTGAAGNNAAWAVGAQGTVLTCSAQCNTTGPTWKTQTHVPTGTPTLTAVNGNDNNHVWAVGLAGTIWYCSNANGQKACNDPGNGATWLAQTPVDPTVDLYGVSAGDNNHVWAVGINCSIWYTTNGGSAWAAQTPPTGCTSTLRGVWAIDNNHAIAVGDGGTILFTGDAGATWVDQCGTATTGACPTSNDQNGVDLQDNNHVWTAADAGLVGFCSSNCNNAALNTTWAPQDTGTGTDLYSVSAGDPTHVWAVGQGGTIEYYSATTPTAIWASEDNSFLLVTLPTPTCPASALPAGTSILIDFAWANDNGDTAATYYVDNGQLVRQVCTRAPDASQTDPFTAGTTVLLSHFLDSTGGVARATVSPPLPACVSSADCVLAPAAVGLQLISTDGHQYSVTGTRRPA